MKLPDVPEACWKLYWVFPIVDNARCGSFDANSQPETGLHSRDDAGPQAQQIDLRLASILGILSIRKHCQ